MLDIGLTFCKRDRAVTTKFALSDDHARQLKGAQVNGVMVNSADRLVIELMDGRLLAVTWQPEGLQTQVIDPSANDDADARPRPTKRQLDYLLFIRKYITRYGRAPAESDIEKHFLVAHPASIR